MRLSELLRQVYGTDRTLIGAEVGVSRGDTSRELLVIFQNLRLYMIDSWTTYPEGHPYRESGDGHAKLTAKQQNENANFAARQTEFAGVRRLILRMTSAEAALKIRDGLLDFAFLDADHTYPGFKSDFWMYWPKVQYGGLICGHDIDHPRDKRGLWGIRRVVEEAAAQLGRPLGCRGDLWWIAKPKKAA